VRIDIRVPARSALERKGVMARLQRVMPRLQQKYEDGEKGALLRAISICAHEGYPLPPWAAKAFDDAYTAVIHDFQFASWDDVFGKPHPKHIKLSAKRQAMRLTLVVWARVIGLREKTPHRDVFPDVAAEFGIGSAVAKQYFRRMEKGLKGWLPTQRALFAAQVRELPPSVYELSK
jgi:hypothetical protein